MSISPSDLLADFVEVDSFAAVQYVRNKIGDNQWQVVVVDLGGGRYALFTLAHLIEALTAWQGSPLPNSIGGAALDQIPGFLEKYAVTAVDISAATTLPEARKQIIRNPLKLGVGVEKGAVRGIIGRSDTVRSGDYPVVSFDALPVGAVTASIPGVLSASEGDGPPTSSKAVDPRIVNVELYDEDLSRLNPKEKPLTKETDYLLYFFVDKVASKFTITGSQNVDIATIFKGDEDALDITVQLESEEFEIQKNVQTLRVPRTGKSDKLKFPIRTKHDGPATINAVLLKDGAFIQVITLKFFVGELFSVETKGREINAAPLLRPRDLSLTILNTGANFQMILSGPTAAMATLPLDKRQLSKWVGQVRQKLLDVVHLEASGVRLYQTRLDIPANVNKHTLPILANAGFDLFEKIFYGPAADMQTRLLGDTFKKLARKETLNIQIFSQEFTLPWGLLYIGDDPDNPEPEHFLGLKHVIEHIPLQPQMQVTDRAINTTKGIQVALNVNKDIDDQMGQPIIQRQIDEWQKLSQGNSNIRVEVRSDAVDVMTALNDGEAVDQILYFYCHAESYNLDEMDKGGADMSRLIMTGHEDLTLRRMSRNRTSLVGQPLVFINACESAELSPEFYDGFVPYFVSKGARGVIGTECETPALFAEEWAKRFFPRFLAGQPLGQIFLDLRREFYNNHNNIMGLLYALYVDGDTYVSNPLMS